MEDFALSIVIPASKERWEIVEAMEEETSQAV